eukprot:jgi/Chrzof1/11537/UNPLg00472.t1
MSSKRHTNCGGSLPNCQAANIPKTDISSKPHGRMPEINELLAKQPPAPQWDPSAIVYTDGSVHKHPYHRVGAGVYDARDRTTYKINPCGRGPTNTIRLDRTCANAPPLSYPGKGTQPTGDPPNRYGGNGTHFGPYSSPAVIRPGIHPGYSVGGW